MYNAGVATRADLHIANDFRALWNDALEPWWRAAAARAWTLPAPTVVLVPTRSHGHFLKSQLLARGLSFAGVTLWTPGECRAFLLNRLNSPLRVASREDLHLLLATVADRHADAPVAHSVALDPSALLRALDTVTAAGWSFAELAGNGLHVLLDEFSATLRAAQLQTAQQADQWLAAHPGQPLIDSLLVVGFTGAHWPQRHLLEAAVRMARAATVCLAPPHDHDWLASWRAATKPLPATPTRAQPVIHVGENLRGQAQAVVAQTIAFLADDACARLAIVVPGRGALAREIAAQLTALELPHYDGIGHYVAPPPDNVAWRAWLDFQQHGRLAAVYELLRHWPAAATRLPAPLAAVERVLDNAFNELLVDDVAVIAAHLSQRDTAESHAIGEALNRFDRLPARAPLMQFIERAVAALAALELTGRAGLIRDRAQTLAHSAALPVRRETFLRWLDECAAGRQRRRDEAGNHPYARVHLLPYAEAAGQTWSHVILTGLNEDEWPPAVEATGFLTEKLIAHLNQRAHATGQPLCVGPAEQRTHAERAFEQLIASAEAGACLTAATGSETEPTRHRIASEPLARRLGDVKLETLRERTMTWLAQSATVEPRAVPDEAARAATRRAFDARRDETAKFGGYEFALDRPPRAPLTLPCKEWERALRDPGSVFLKRVLGVEPPRGVTDEDRWALATGTWIHRWLRHAADPAGARAFVRMPATEELMRALRDAAHATRRDAARAFDGAGRALPQWWAAGWAEALWKAKQCAAMLPAWPWLAAEWNLPEGVAAKLPDGGALRLKGRIDLLLAQQNGIENGTLWVLDFKSGRTKTRLSAGNLAKGEGVQIALYALALQARGAAAVTANVVRPGEPVEEGLTQAAVAGATSVWQTLAAMQDRGVFGMNGELRPEFGVPRVYPLATLAVDDETLATKWALTHPQLAREEEEE